LKIEGIPTSESSKISCRGDRDILFFAVSTVIQYKVIPWHFFSHAHSSKMILGKFLKNYPCMKYLLEQLYIVVYSTGRTCLQLKRFFCTTADYQSVDCRDYRVTQKLTVMANCCRGWGGCSGGSSAVL
jgi:hypothetical protein